MKRIIFLLALVMTVFLMILFSACEKTVHIDIPQKDPKLTISAWLKTGEVINMTIGKSRNILDPASTGNPFESYVVNNATPVVYENGIAIDTLVYNPNTFHYFSAGSKKIRDGYNYTIKVKAPGFTEAVVETITPSQSQIASIQLNRHVRTNSSGEQIDDIILKLDDPTEKNFYIVKIYSRGYNGGGSVPGFPVWCVSTTDKDVEPLNNVDPLDPDNRFDGNNIMMKDVNFNGGQKQLKLSVQSFYMDEFVNNNRTYRPYLEVYRVTEAYFKYLKSYDAYESGRDNPFAEPANVYSNVTNGYGTFSTYTVAVDTLR